jgi:hypothetical protein
LDKESSIFNSDLIDKQIAANNIILTSYNMGGHFTFWLVYTNISILHKQITIETSYLPLSIITFMSSPVLKGGLNYQYIAFSKLKCQQFILAKRNLMLLNCFWKYLRTEERNCKVLVLQLNVTGFQFIEDNSKQWTYRRKRNLAIGSPEGLQTNNLSVLK